MVAVIAVLVVIIPSQRSGVDMLGFLGSLLSSGASLVGGLFGQKNQAAINQQNINEANYLASNAIRMRVADAKAAGINPLAALGSSFSPSAPQAVGSDALSTGISGMGQNIGRALQAYGDANSKAAELDNAYKQAQIDLVHSETAKNLVASQAAVAAQPGTPPGLGILDASGNPVKTLPQMFTSYSPAPGARPIKVLTPAAQQSVFSGVPGAVTYPEISGWLVDQYVPPASLPSRGDVLRWMQNRAYDPALFGGGM